MEVAISAVQPSHACEAHGAVYAQAIAFRISNNEDSPNGIVRWASILSALETTKELLNHYKGIHDKVVSVVQPNIKWSNQKMGYRHMVQNTATSEKRSWSWHWARASAAARVGTWK